MIYLRLFFEFFKTGLFSIGGGLATLPFLYEMSDKTHWFLCRFQDSGISGRYRGHCRTGDPLSDHHSDHLRLPAEVPEQQACPERSLRPPSCLNRHDHGSGSQCRQGRPGQYRCLHGKSQDYRPVFVQGDPSWSHHLRRAETVPQDPSHCIHRLLGGRRHRLPFCRRLSHRQNGLIAAQCHSKEKSRFSRTSDGKPCRNGILLI